MDIKNFNCSFIIADYDKTVRMGGVYGLTGSLIVFGASEYIEKVINDYLKSTDMDERKAKIISKAVRIAYIGTFGALYGYSIAKRSVMGTMESTRVSINGKLIVKKTKA